jgi:hypothetical protein
MQQAQMQMQAGDSHALGLQARRRVIQRREMFSPPSLHQVREVEVFKEPFQPNIQWASTSRQESDTPIFIRISAA